MKKFLILLATLFCGAVFADTINLHYLNEDNTVYENSTCTIGNDLILPSTPPTKRGYTFAGWRSANIRRIEYLESTGTQWIDTGVYPNSYFAYELKFSGYSIPIVPTENIMFGETSIDWKTMIGINQSKNATGRSNVIPYIKYDGVSCTFKQQTSGTFLLNSTGLYYNNSLVFSQTPNTFDTETYSIYLFAVNRQGVASNEASKLSQSSFTKYRLEYFKIWNDRNILVRNFIPSLDENNTPCLYDTVEGKFYYNQGTGDFIAGPVLGAVDVK